MKKQYSLILALLFAAALMLVFSAAALGMSDYRSTTLDCTSFSSNQQSSNEGWAWNAATRTLTLDDADIDVENGPAVILPAKSTLVLKGTWCNYLYSANDAAIIAKGDLTIKNDGESEFYGNGDAIVDVDGDLTLSGTEITLYPAMGDELELKGSQHEVPFINYGLRVDGSLNMDDGAYLSIATSRTCILVNNDMNVEDDSELICSYVPGNTGVVIKNGRLYVSDSEVEVWANDNGHPQLAKSIDPSIVVLEYDENDGSVAIQVRGKTRNLIRLVKCGAVEPDLWFGERELFAETCAADGDYDIASFVLEKGDLSYRGGVLTGAARNVLISPEYESEDITEEGLIGLIRDNSARLPFTDVYKGTVEYEAVRYVYHNGLMQGVSATAFDLKSYVNRAMTVTVLHRLAGTPAAADSPFKDIPAGSWYKEAANWGHANNIVKGVDANTFSGLTLLTKEQLAAFFYRYAEFKGYDTTNRASLVGYIDYDSISEYAKAPMGWALSLGMFQMNRVGYIEPQSYVTRGELAKALRAFDEAY